MAEEKKKSSGAKRIAINQPFVEAAINRKASGKMTQHELADKIGVDRTTLYHVMKGERVSAETLVSLSLFLNEPLESLAADPKDALKVMKKVLTDDINRMEAQEIQALWALFLPFRTKKKTLREVLRESEALEQHPFKLMMYLLTEEGDHLRNDIGQWLQKSDQREFFMNRQVAKEFYEKIEGLFGRERKRRSA
jgi:transcriptional regulator with XRE-family HTH domain